MIEKIDDIEQERYHVTTDVEAGKQFQKLAELDQQENELKEQKQAYVNQINEWFKRKMNAINGAKDNAQALINEYRLTKPDGKVDTPYGQIIVRHSTKTKYDDKVLADFLKDSHPELLKYSVNKVELKKAVKNVDGKAVDENGEVISGIQFEQAESISYKLTKQE